MHAKNQASPVFFKKKPSCFPSSHDNNVTETQNFILAWRDPELFLSEAKTFARITWLKPRSHTFTPFHQFRWKPTCNKGRRSRGQSRRWESKPRHTANSQLYAAVPKKSF